MSIARHHAEWLSLIEVSGPFLSMPVLLRVFPQGLDAHDTEYAKTLRLAFEEWQDSQQSARPDLAIHHEWIRFVLRETLEFPDEVLTEGQRLPAGLAASMIEHAETLRPDLAVITPADLFVVTPSGAVRAEKGKPSNHSRSLFDPDDSMPEGITTNLPQVGKPQMLIQIYPPTQPLEKPIPDRRWKATPATRMMELLHATEVPLGLLTNGEHWMLVHAPRNETSGFASWYASLWLEENVTLRAFRSLLSVRRFFGVTESDTLAALYKESSQDQHEVTNQLGYQVRHAVELLIQALDRADQDRGHKLLHEVAEPQMYEAALTVMMRLVFLFSAEERGLLLLGDPLYDQHYAVSTLRAQLREAADQHGEEVLERRFDAWSRLLATFRAVFGGLQHDRLTLPAYGGSLFDPDRFLFLEGRPPKTKWRETPAEPLPINNRIALHLLEALQILQVKVPGGGPAEARRLSFRALDIEQIGHVYESLLDHTAVRATEPVLGLKGTRDKEPEISLAQLEALLAKGEDELVEFLQRQTGRSESALRRAIENEKDHKAAQRNASAAQDTQRLRAACGNETRLYKRVSAFAGLIRDDDFGYPVVIPKGSVYVTAGTDRRSSGTHYTPRSLTEPIVQHTLEPLVYHGPAEGWSKEKWQLRSAAELLELKVCDMAMGSGAFLVQTCRYLAERLMEAWEEASKQLTVVSDQLSVSSDQSLITDNCSLVTGPRITPEGKLSTGAPCETLIPLDADERMTFAQRIVVDRCLYGVDKNPLAVEMAKLSLWLITLAKNRPFTFLDHALKCGDSLVGADEKTLLQWARGADDNQMSAFEKQLEEQLALSRSKRRELESFEVIDVRDAERKSALLVEADTALSRVKLGCDLIIGTTLLGVKAKAQEERLRNSLIEYLNNETLDNEESQKTIGAARRARAFHWPFEFPEVFEKGGFNAFVGNPPFLGGKRIGTVFGDTYQIGLKSIAANVKGAADLCSYFFLRSFELVEHNGSFGLIATNTISQGDTKEIGLDYLISSGAVIRRATSSYPWPGTAGVFVSIVWISKKSWRGSRFLDDMLVDNITGALVNELQLGQAKPLKENKGLISEGVKIHGNGFIIDQTEREHLIKLNHQYANLIQPYLGGEDVATSSSISAPRYVINFRNWNKEEAKKHLHLFDIVTKRVKSYREGLRGQIHETRYWIYWDRRESFFERLDKTKHILVCSGTAKYLALVFVSNEAVLSQKLKVFAYQDYDSFSVLQSSLHELWVRRHSSTLGETLSYSNSDAFLTFSMPRLKEYKNRIGLIGEKYHEHRRQLMLDRQEGLTKTYNRFHNPDESSADIVRLRELHVEMDHAVAAAYGWSDLDLGHGFYQTPQGLRFTLSELARREVLERLLKLNHERYEEEVRQGLHDKGSKKQRAKGKKQEQPNLPDMFEGMSEG